MIYDDREDVFTKGLLKINDYIDKFYDKVDPCSKPIEEQPSWMRFIRPVVYSKPYTFLESFCWNESQLPSVEKPKPKPKKIFQVYRPDHEFTPQQIEEAKELALQRELSRYFRSTSGFYRERSTYCPLKEEDKTRRRKRLAAITRLHNRKIRNIETGKFSPYYEFKKRLDKELPGDDAGSSKSPERIQQEMRNPSGMA